MLGLAQRARAQVMGIPLEQGAFQFGYAYKWFHRDMEPNFPTEMRWEVGTFFARYGGFEWLTISIEGVAYSFEHEDFPELEYRRYAVGAGLAARLYRRGPWEIAGVFNYSEVWDHDDSPNNFHKRTSGLTAAMLLGRSFAYRDQKAFLWVGPAYVDDVAETYPWDSNDPIRNESVHNFGIAGGAEVLLFRHCAGFAYVVYTDYVQPRLGFAYQIGGGQ
jgi:hypothetical protein